MVLTPHHRRPRGQLGNWAIELRIGAAERVSEDSTHASEQHAGVLEPGPERVQDSVRAGEQRDAQEEHEDIAEKNNDG